MMDKFESELIRHKKLMSQACKTENKDLIAILSKLSKELSLVHSQFKCEKCKRDYNLTYHHCITRSYKTFLDFWKYVSMRHYWNNIIILCKDCHDLIHLVNRTDSEGLETISDGTINRIKKKYKIESQD